MYRDFFKRVLDTIVAVFGLIVLSPLAILIYVVIFFWTGENPLFFQARPGLKENIFYLVKFKTMNNKRDLNGNLLPDKERLTAIGQFIRSTSLDEIPQLLNVIKGEMSLIGPRPLLVDYLPLYNDFQKRRHEVRPGISGWAQINGRNSISWEEKFMLDVWYVDHLSFKTDLMIIWFTIIKVLKREDINQFREIPMEKFEGSN